jgi:type I restriction enzyme M protein
MAGRLDEIISAHSGEDPFEEALKLLVAKMAHEVSENNQRKFLSDLAESELPREVNRLLGQACEKWRGIIEPGTCINLNGSELYRCSEVLRDVELLSSDLVSLDAIFEFIVNKAAKGQKGQYFTPRFVIDEIVKMIDPLPGETVVDPACGSGGFLRHAIRHSPECSVWGFDQDARAIRIARVMMATSKQPASRIIRTDSLRRPNRELFPESSPVIEDFVKTNDPKLRGFDVVMTNPPFAGDVGMEYSNSYEAAKNKRVERDALFLERCIELLKPGGRLAIILPYNKVGGASWLFLRAWLLEHLQVVSVISLGRNTFQPHTSQKACVVIGVKRNKCTKNYRDEEVLLFLSDKDGKDNRGKISYKSDGVEVDHDLYEASILVKKQFASLKRGV